MKSYEYPGAIHIHSTYSDGTASIDSIIKDAQKAGLKWIIITDHDSLAGLEKGYEGYHKDLCVIIGSEISPEKGNHFLALNIKEPVPANLSPEEFIQKVNDQGGFGFIAHPDEKDNRNNEYSCLRWDNWNINHFQGLEIWNYLSDWVDTLTPENKVQKFLHPDESLQGPTEDVLKWWDNLNCNSDRIFPGIAGIDVHAFNKKFLIFPIKVFSYLKSFKTLRNYIQTDEILSKDFETAKNQIYTALKAGNNLMINYHWGSSEGVVFTITKEDANRKFVKATVGEILTVNKDFIIDIETPVPTFINLVHNGDIIKQEITSHLKHKTDQPGIYRFEAYKENFHWILSNPIKVVKAND